MKVRVPMMVDDARFAPLDRPDLIEGFDIDREDYFLDGPATSRVAVVDRDPATGRILPGARFVPPSGRRVRGYYEGSDPVDVRSRTFNQLSVFATVLKTLYMFEEPDTLGRRVRWAFDAPQLFIVPRAGSLIDAFYSRDEHSLLFHSFPNPKNPAETVHTSLARDIVAHETAHAILDGIAPHLWHAITPQCLALQEAVADLTALLVSLRSRKLIRAVLAKTGGSIEHSTHFSALAEEFGHAVGAGALRDLKNDLTVQDVKSLGAHRLSQPLTGALYSVLVKMHDARRREAALRRDTSEYSASGYALFGAAQHFKRMTLRALDYLPPGEVSFADYGRAIIAADRASHPADDRKRQWMVEEFVRRGIVRSSSALDVTISPGADELLAGVDLAAVTNEDDSAYAFAGSERGRALLGIPECAPFHIEPRLEVSKVYYHRTAGGVLEVETVLECLFKVWWRQEEPNEIGAVPRRGLIVGTTLCWDCGTGKIRTLLTSDHRHRPEEQAEQQRDRDRFLAGLLQGEPLLEGSRSLHRGDSSRGPRLVEENGSLVGRNTGRLLHSGYLFGVSNGEMYDASQPRDDADGATRPN